MYDYKLPNLADSIDVSSEDWREAAQRIFKSQKNFKLASRIPELTLFLAHKFLTDLPEPEKLVL